MVSKEQFFSKSFVFVRRDHHMHVTFVVHSLYKVYWTLLGNISFSQDFHGTLIPTLRIYKYFLLPTFYLAYK